VVTGSQGANGGVTASSISISSSATGGSAGTSGSSSGTQQQLFGSG
jgi:hypothetical protein